MTLQEQEAIQIYQSSGSLTDSLSQALSARVSRWASWLFSWRAEHVFEQACRCGFVSRVFGFREPLFGLVMGKLTIRLSSFDTVSVKANHQLSESPAVCFLPKHVSPVNWGYQQHCEVLCGC